MESVCLKKSMDSKAKKDLFDVSSFITVCYINYGIAIVSTHLEFDDAGGN